MNSQGHSKSTNLKPIFTFLAALLLAPLFPAQADLVAHFRFDDDLKDLTGQHDGRPVDPKLAPSFAPGRVGSAVVIEKVNAGIELANPSAIDFSRDFTIATWVNVGNYYAEMPVLFKGRAERTAAPDKFFGVFGIEGMQVHGEGQGEWITNFRASKGLVPNDGGWHHIAVTYRAAEAPHFTLYVDGQGKTPADKGTFRGGDFTLQPDAPDSVLRLGCRADGDTWRYVRSHLRGLLDELQLYNEALKAEDIRFLFENPGGTMKQRDAISFAPRFQFDPGHPWRPPFGVERVGLTPVIVQFASDTHPAPEHWLAAYREGKEVERKALDVVGNSPFTARVTFTTSPAPEKLVLLAMSGLSESAFSRLFKTGTQRTVPQYVNELRIARACRLLAETDQTVSQIADACGYPTPAHFQRQFHRHQSRSPLIYRLAVRKQG